MGCEKTAAPLSDAAYCLVLEGSVGTEGEGQLHATTRREPQGLRVHSPRRMEARLGEDGRTPFPGDLQATQQPKLLSSRLICYATRGWGPLPHTGS